MVHVLVHHVAWSMNIAVLFFYTVPQTQANCFSLSPFLRCKVLLLSLPLSLPVWTLDRSRAKMS